MVDQMKKICCKLERSVSVLMNVLAVASGSTYKINFPPHEPVIRSLYCQEVRVGHESCVNQWSRVVDEIQANDGGAQNDCLI